MQPLEGILMCAVSIEKWDTYHQQPLPPTPKSVEDMADALQKHLNDTEEQALPLLMCSFTKLHTMRSSPGTRECNECREWVCSFFKVG